MWQHRRKDGSLIDVEITAGRVVYGGRDAALVAAHDVTERRRMQERLAEAEKMEAVGRLAGGVAHDFNNLLTVISGYAALLRGAGNGDREPLRRDPARRRRARAPSPRQLLAFSRRQVLRPEPVDLNEIVAGMETMLGRIIGDDVQVAVQPAPGLTADRGRPGPGGAGSCSTWRSTRATRCPRAAC